MKEITLCNQKGVALVDDEDFEYLSKFTWYAHTTGYVTTSIKGKTILMHRFIMQPKKNFIIDHRNRNKLDNRKINLRICSQSQNLSYKIKSEGTTSIYNGVHYDKDRNKWSATIKINKSNVFIGRFDKQRHAAIARDIWAKELHGEFARLNF